MFQVESQGAVDVITLNVPLTNEYVSQLEETVESGLHEGQPLVVLDMSAVPLIDSAGLESLLDVQQELLKKGGIFKMAALTPLSEDILRVTGIEQYIETHPDVKSAVRSFVR